MACCKIKTGVGKAVLSCFVKDNGTLYAIVCKHARNVAQDEFFVRDRSGNEILLATKLKRKISAAETYNHHDIDIIEVKKGQVHLCKSVFRNRNREVHDRVRIFGGSVEELFEETVFMCIQSGARNEFIIRLGEVLPSQKIDDVLKSSYSLATHFFVGSKDKTTFAEAGDSGRVVAREADDGCLELIGIVLQKYKDTTICLLLRSGLNFLNQQYNIQLSLCESSNVSDDEAVGPGETVTFVTNL